MKQNFKHTRSVGCQMKAIYRFKYQVFRLDKPTRSLVFDTQS